MGGKELDIHYYIFRVVRVGDKKTSSLYVLEFNPLEHDRGNVAHVDLPSLAKALVEYQLDYLRSLGMSGDDDFSFSFTFQPPYDVKMQRTSFWQASQLTDAEKKEFLDQVKHHYLQQCDPEGYEKEFPEDCEIF